MSSEYEIIKYAQDRNPNSHIHEELEILISLNSEGKFFVREHGYPLRFGMVFILPPFEIHRCFCNGNQNYDRYIIHFKRELLKKMSTNHTDLLELFGSCPLVCQASDDILAKMMSDLAALVKEQGTEFGDDIARNLQFQNFLLTVARFFKSVERGPHLALENEGRVGEILSYIHVNYMHQLTLDTITKELFISRSQLSQVFKNETGFSVGDYIIMYRIKRACSLLQGGMSVQDVGATVGFQSTANFIRIFKKEWVAPRVNLHRPNRRSSIKAFKGVKAQQAGDAVFCNHFR